MPSANNTRARMPELAASKRVRDFREVAAGYSAETAVAEARRCARCAKPPCALGCPVNVDIPRFVGLTASGSFREAYDVIKKTNALPAICGRVCPQETQCEALCVMGRRGEPVAIGNLERFVADRAIAEEDERENASDACADNSAADAVAQPRVTVSSRPRVAVVGSGPASLACAGELLSLGADATIFEAFHLPGGVLTYGIPEFRLPKDLVSREISQLTKAGAKILTNTVIGKTLDFADLWALGYDAIFVGSGAGLPSFMRVPGENLNGVYSANEYLTRVNLMKAYKFPAVDTPVKRGRRVSIIGGGNVGLDSARCALRLGAEVSRIIYRRSEREMPARAEELRHAKDEGVVLTTLTRPKRIVDRGDGWVCGLECARMELGEKDASGRASPVEIPGSNFMIETDIVVVAIGQSPNPIIKNSEPELITNSWGGIAADEATGATSIPGVFAGGDAVTGAATVILAMGAGKKAAAGIAAYIRQKNAIGSTRLGSE